MTNATPMLLAVAPNGARKQYKDHPALPITPEELAQTADLCLAAGAGMMHVHVRDNESNHCIDPSRYAEAFKAIRHKTGESLFLQATTEAVGKYRAEEQIDMVYKLANLQKGEPAFGISIAVREVLSENICDESISEFFIFLKEKNILPQLIIYDFADRNRFQDLLRRGVLLGTAYPCLFVLGRYSEEQQSNPAELLPFFSNLYGVKNWMGCAFGAREFDIAQAAALLGGHMRIGYENNTLLASGETSENNAALITQSAQQIPKLQRTIAQGKIAELIMTPDW